MVAEPGKEVLPCKTHPVSDTNSIIANRAVTAVQASALAVVVAAAAALVYLVTSQIGYVRLIADERPAIARAESANIDLQDGVADLRHRFAVTTPDLAVAENRLLAPSAANTNRPRRDSAGSSSCRSPKTPQPPELAAEVGSVEPMLSEPAPSEVNRSFPLPECTTH